MSNFSVNTVLATGVKLSVDIVITKACIYLSIYMIDRMHNLQESLLILSFQCIALRYQPTDVYFHDAQDS